MTRSVVFVAFQSERRANGGIQSLTHIMDGLREFRPVIVTQRESAATAQWRQQGHEVHVWPMAGPAINRDRPWALRQAERVPRLLQTNLRLANLLRTTGSRVVHCNDAWALNHAALAARLTGARIVFNIRDTTGVAGHKWRLMRALSDEVVVLSDEMKSHVEHSLASEGAWKSTRMAPVRRVYSIVPQRAAASPSERQRLRAELGIPAGTVAVGIVGVVSEKKQQRELLRAIRDREPVSADKLHFYFVGDYHPDSETYSRECRDLLQHPRLSRRATMVGFSGRVSEWLLALDQCLIVSRDEGLARAMIESMAAGLPVVSFGVCSASEILEGHGCGRVVPINDFPEALHQVELLGLGDNERERLGDNGRKAAAQLFSTANAQEYESIYTRLTAGRGRGPVPLKHRTSTVS